MTLGTHKEQNNSHINIPQFLNGHIFSVIEHQKWLRNGFSDMQYKSDKNQVVSVIYTNLEL